VSEQVLDDNDIGIGIEKLGGHGVPQLVTGNLETAAFGIVFHSLLNASNRQRLPFTGSLLNEKHRLGPRT
jgi:hypothetical protein